MVQTFLPFADFHRSAASLDQARLGKQRVETLQILRALVIPDYGWQSHPAVRMWMGYVPALTLYGLAMVDEWTSRGGSDSTRSNILELAPEAAAEDLSNIPMPPWLGDPALHRSHRSRLIAKAPDVYRNKFPGTPSDLDYVWPEPENVLVPHDPPEPRLWILRIGPGRADSTQEDPEAVDEIALPPPAVASSRKYQRQLANFKALRPGDDVGIPLEGGLRFAVGRVMNRPAGSASTRRAWRLNDILDRSVFSYPALLQDPRLFFPVSAP